MGKRDKFAQLLNNTNNTVSQDKSVVDDFIEEISDKTSKESQAKEEPGLLFAPADRFVSYSDEKLRLELHSGEERDRLKESIQNNGVINPVICKKKDEYLEILSGHNRVDICKELNIYVPYILKDNISKDEADLIVIDTNLLNRQRSDYKPTRFAYILKVKFDAEKHQGTMLTGDTKLTGEKIGEKYGLSRIMIHRYIKLNDLIYSAKQMVDDGDITMKAAYELSFFESNVQSIIVNMTNKYVVNDKSLNNLRKGMDGKEFSDEEDLVHFIELYLTQKDAKKRKFDYRNIKSYLPKGIKDDEIEDHVINALKMYNQYLGNNNLENNN